MKAGGNFQPSKFVVFNLSSNSNQKKNLCLAWHDDFQIQEKCGGAG
jgi:hypothetical protein